MYPVNLMMKMCHGVIRQCEGYTQHKPKVVDYNEPFHDFFATGPIKVCSKEKVLKKLQLSILIVKVLLTLGLHAVFIEFCINYG